ncbi:putative arabinosyltransferase B domain protein [Mycobacterium xenopi 4042]|uniref:Putative arabinosyltransferase B domain protein n=1 Tax=Mycobacterium xenopi 4042 TaxID=1299334 RepID=X8DLQ4_MYCXE|nr:putative arabinosyltransferase B domain protein [Mycobacterium xenopi 4042]
MLELGRPGPDGVPVPSGRLVPYDLYGEQPKAWRNLRFPAPRSRRR